MIEIASCFSHEALKFSTPSCSSNSTKSSNISPSPSHISSICNVIAYIYRTDLPARKTQILIVVTWCVAPGGPHLLVEFQHHGSPKEAPCVRIGTSPGLFGRNRGRKRLECWDAHVVISWDFSKARFVVGSPEPVGGFYITILVDSELGLVLGDGGRTCSSGSENSVLVSKREELFGKGMYSTGARFRRDGELHDILIKCWESEQGKEDGIDQQKPCSTLRVYVDKKLVMKAKRLQWNFRGSQTIFVDGSAIEFMWNVHDWFDNVGAGPGVFMFRTRSRNRVEMERDDDNGGGDGDGEGGFSLLLCANKNRS